MVVEDIDDPDETDIISSKGSYEFLTLYASWANNTANTFTTRECNLSLAVVSYPVQIANGTTTLDIASGTNPDVVAILPTAQATSPLSGASLSKSTTLGGFALIGDVSAETPGPFYSNVTMEGNGALALWKLYGLTPFAWSNPTDPNWDVNNLDAAGYTWRDPVPEILAAYHDIMFRLSLQVGSNTGLVPPITLNGTEYTSRSNVNATQIVAQSYYVSRYSFLAGAVVVVLLANLSVTFLQVFH